MKIRADPRRQLMAVFLATITAASASAAIGRTQTPEFFGCQPDGPVCTKAFQAAVDNVSASGGGILNVVGPGAYTVAGIEMKSDVTLVVHAGATINASAVLADWGPRRMVLPACAKTEPAELEHGVLGGLFYASLAKNFTIRVSTHADEEACPVFVSPVVSHPPPQLDFHGCCTLTGCLWLALQGPGAVNGAAKAWNDYGVKAITQATAPPNPHGLVRSNMFVFAQCTDVVVEVRFFTVFHGFSSFLIVFHCVLLYVSLIFTVFL